MAIPAPLSSIAVYTKFFTPSKKLKNHGYHFIEPHEGFFAAGGFGKGELATVEEISDYIIKLIG